MSTYELDRATVESNLLASVGPSFAKQILDTIAPTINLDPLFVPKLTLFQNFKLGDVVPPDVQLLVVDPVVSDKISVVPTGPAAVIFSGSTGVQVVLDGAAQQLVKMGQGGDVVTLRENASGRIVDLGAGDDTFVGNAGTNVVVTGPGSDKVETKDGNDIVDISNSSATVDGGTGFDAIKVAGKKSDYLISNDNGVIVLKSKDATLQSVVQNSEYINFDDGSVIINVANQDQAVVARFYEIVLDRPADREGVINWLGTVDTKTASPVELAAKFLASQEFTSKHGSLDSLSDADFLQLMYQKAFNRPGEAAGVEGWIAEMQAGMTRAEVVVRFANTSEIEQTFDGSINIIKGLS